MAKEYVKIFVGVPTQSAKRNIDGRMFESPVESILKVVGDFADRGVGVVGNYDNVSFTFAKGEGRYRAIPNSGATPTKGEIGELHKEEEVVVTFIAPKEALSPLVHALKENHPYETPVIEVFDLARHELDSLPQ